MTTVNNGLPGATPPGLQVVHGNPSGDCDVQLST